MYGILPFILQGTESESKGEMTTYAVSILLVKKKKRTTLEDQANRMKRGRTSNR